MCLAQLTAAADPSFLLGRSLITLRTGQGFGIRALIVFIPAGALSMPDRRQAGPGNLSASLPIGNSHTPGLGSRSHTHRHPHLLAPSREQLLELPSVSSCPVPHLTCPRAFQQLLLPGLTWREAPASGVRVRQIIKAQCREVPCGGCSGAVKATGPAAAQGWCTHPRLHSAPRRWESGSAAQCPPCRQTRTAQAPHSQGGRCRRQASCPG